MNNLEERLKLLEEKAIESIIELEKRIEELQPSKDLASRVRVMEDVLMTLQLELGRPVNNKMEVVNKVKEFEKKIEMMSEYPAEARIKNLENFFMREMSSIDKRIRAVEERMSLKKNNNLVDEIHGILKS